MLTQKEITALNNLGALNYFGNECDVILGWPIGTFLSRYTRGGEVKTHYDAGRIKAQYKVDLQLFELAKEGDIDAYRQYMSIISTKDDRHEEAALMEQLMAEKMENDSDPDPHR